MLRFHRRKPDELNWRMAAPETMRRRSRAKALAASRRKAVRRPEVGAQNIHVIAEDHTSKPSPSAGMRRR